MIPTYLILLDTIEFLLRNFILPQKSFGSFFLLIKIYCKKIFSIFKKEFSSFSFFKILNTPDIDFLTKLDLHLDNLKQELKYNFRLRFIFQSYTHVFELLHVKPLLHQPQGHESPG